MCFLSMSCCAPSERTSCPVIETLQSNVTQLEAQILETQKLKCGLERDLEAERLLREQKSKVHAAPLSQTLPSRSVHLSVLLCEV